VSIVKRHTNSKLGAALDNNGHPIITSFATKQFGVRSFCYSGVRRIFEYVVDYAFLHGFAKGQ
jgi:hypothetical protein